MKDAKLSGYCSCMKANKQEDFQICISIPLKGARKNAPGKNASRKNAPGESALRKIAWVIIFVSEEIRRLLQQIVILNYSSFEKFADSLINCNIWKRPP